MSDGTDDLIDENRRRLPAVTLREWTQNGVWSSLRAHIAADGTLVISGHVLGPKATLIGDELEFWIKVDHEYLDRLGVLLSRLLKSDEPATTAIPAQLRHAFDQGEFETSWQVQDWMTQNSIPSSFSSWP